MRMRNTQNAQPCFSYFFFDEATKCAFRRQNGFFTQGTLIYFSSLEKGKLLHSSICGQMLRCLTFLKRSRPSQESHKKQTIFGAYRNHWVQLIPPAIFPHPSFESVERNETCFSWFPIRNQNRSDSVILDTFIA